MRQLAVVAILAALSLITPYAVPFAAIAAALWGELLLIYVYGLKAQLEPLRIRVDTPHGPAAYDPRRRLYHYFWLAEPTRSELGASAAWSLHELWASLALSEKEAIAFIQIGTMKLIRYTAPALERLGQIESALRHYFVLKRADPWISAGPPPSRLIYAPALAYAALALLLKPPALAVAVLLIYLARRARRHYREAAVYFATASRARDVGTSRATLEALSSAEATSIAKSERWAVVVRPRPETKLEREFSRAYESISEKGRTVIKLQRVAQLVERMVKHDERPVLIAAFSDREIPTQMRIEKDPLATWRFWTMWGMAKGMSGDLMRFPVLYGGKHLEAGRKVLLGHDKFGRPVVVDIDAMPAAHSIIVGPTGMGKSWTVATWARKFAETGVRLVFIDPHGDYAKLASRIGARVVKTPPQMPADLAERLRGKKTAQKLLREFELGDSLDAVLRELGLAEPVPPDGGHVVYDLTPMVHDAELQSFLASLLLLYYHTYYEGRPAGERVSTLVVVDEARLLTTRAAYTAGGLLTNTILDLIRSMSMGGRKYGYAIWLVVQQISQVPEDVVRNANMVLVLGGAKHSIMPAISLLGLDRDDESYLLSATTPRESGARPYAMGVLLLTPRHLKYHVRIPLDAELK